MWLGSTFTYIKPHIYKTHIYIYNRKYITKQGSSHIHKKKKVLSHIYDHRRPLTEEIILKNIWNPVS